MSQWCHIYGCLKLSSSIFDVKEDKLGRKYYSLPYPDEQFILGIPYEFKNYKDEHFTCIDVFEYSLPRVKPIIDKLIKSIMPQGEGMLNYFLNQDKYGHDTSSNYFSLNIEKKLFEEKALKYFNSNPSQYDPYRDYNQLKLFKDLDLGWVHELYDFTLTIDDDIRHCSSKDLKEGFEKLFKAFKENNIDIERGIIEWKDEYEDEKIFQVHINEAGSPVYKEINIAEVNEG